MKGISLIAAVAIIFMSCGNNSETETSRVDTTTVSQPETNDKEENIPQVRPAFASLDGNVSSHVKNIFDHYIHIKTALVNSDPAEAKKGANALLEVIRGFDKSLLPAEQKTAYDKSIGGIRASANNIATANDIEKQREHFSNLSNQAYELAKSFGAGKTLYHEHCPMAFNDKGAMWLSETKDIKNPYFGDEMMECGTVEEVIEK